MPLFWKTFVVLLLTLPLGAYVAGSVAGPRGQLPSPTPPAAAEEQRPATASDGDPSAGPREDRSGDDDADSAEVRVEEARTDADDAETEDPGDDTDDTDDTGTEASESEASKSKASKSKATKSKVTKSKVTGSATSD